MLTTIGLTLNFIGAVLLLGTDVAIIEKALKKVDPVHLVYTRGLYHIIDESTSRKMVQNHRAHPYNKKISSDSLRLWPLLRFIDRHVEQNLSRNGEVDIRGGSFKFNEEQLTFPDKRTIQLEESARLNAGKTLTLNGVFGLLYEARIRRIYLYGGSLLALGFLFRGCHRTLVTP